MTFSSRADYIRSTFAPETEVLARIRESAGTDHDKICIHPEEGKILQLLIRLSGSKKIVEIGTLHGYSALWMAAALPQDGHLYTIEKDPMRAKAARTHLSGHRNITLIEGDAGAVLSSLAPDGPFDMIFIDADKLHYADYLDWAESHVRKGGLIIGDNTFLFDAVWKVEEVERVRETARQAMRVFNQRLADPLRYCSIMLETAEGLTIAQKLF